MSAAPALPCPPLPSPALLCPCITRITVASEPSPPPRTKGTPSGSRQPGGRGGRRRDPPPCRLWGAGGHHPRANAATSGVELPPPALPPHMGVGEVRQEPPHTLWGGAELHPQNPGFKSRPPRQPMRPGGGERGGSARSFRPPCLAGSGPPAPPPGPRTDTDTRPVRPGPTAAWPPVSPPPALATPRPPCARASPGDTRTLGAGPAGVRHVGPCCCRVGGAGWGGRGP